MSFSLFISKKFILSKKQSKTLSIFAFISIAGIAIGVAALIITLSVLSGFEKNIFEKLTNLDSHIQIKGFGEKLLPDFENNLIKIKQITGNDLSQIDPVISKTSIISHSNFKEGITLKGVQQNYFANKNNIELIQGTFILKQNEIAIGKKLANKLLINLNDFVTIFSLKNETNLNLNDFPIIDNFKVVGIFESGMSKYDDSFAFISFETAQEFLQTKTKISSIEIQLNDFTKIDSLSIVLQDRLRYPYYVKTIYQTNKHIFTWIELQKKPIPIVLSLIIIVAVFNIISTILMIILDKINAIGILISLGAAKKQINNIFLINGIYIGSLGIILGNILAFILSTVQQKFDIITLPSSVYFTSKVPLLLEANNFILVSAVSFCLIVLVSYLSSYFASRINPLSTIRFQ